MSKKKEKFLPPDAIKLKKKSYLLINVNSMRLIGSKGWFFKFGVEVGVGESIESAPLV
jgi:hypothetical protein